MFARQPHPRGRLDRGHGDGEGLLVGAKLEHRVPQLKPVTLVGNGLGILAQADDDAQGLVHHLPLPLRVDAQHVGVGGQGAWADSQDHPAPGQMVQQHHAVGYHIGVVIGQAHHAGAQPDVAGATGGRGDEHLRRSDGLPARAVVLADVGLVEPQHVQPFQQLQVPLQGQGRVLPHPVEGGQENPELHSTSGCCHASPLSIRWADARRGLGQKPLG